MNASAAVLPREVEVQSKMRKIRAFGHSAHAVCSLLYGFGLLVSLIVVVTMLYSVLGSPETKDNDGGMYDILMSPLTPLLFKLLMWSVVGFGLGVWLKMVYELQRLFGTMADGAIYTTENVRCIRYVGLLWLLATFLKIAIPIALSLARPFIDASVRIDLDRVSVSLGEILTSLIAAGLILLVSWIMDVGLYEKEHADVLERDAELTI